MTSPDALVVTFGKFTVRVFAGIGKPDAFGVDQPGSRN
jgi:hypothetical protein